MAVLTFSSEGTFVKTGPALLTPVGGLVDKTTVVTDNVTLTTDVTFPTGSKFVVEPGAVITVPAGKTLDVSAAEFVVPKHSWYTGAGTVTFSAAGNATQDLLAKGVTLVDALDEAKGTDIASATTTDIGAATGNYVKVTGVTTITGLGTATAGVRRIVEFTGALTLTHNATSLILPTGANIITVAGDVGTFVSLGSGNWKCTGFTHHYGGQRLNLGKATYTSAGAIAATIPTDTSIPAVSEGSEIMTLSATANNAASTIEINVSVVMLGNAAACSAALFKDTTCIGSAVLQPFTGQSAAPPTNFTVSIPAVDKTAHTYSVRVGSNTGADTYMNGHSAYTMGGTFTSSMTVTEILP